MENNVNANGKEFVNCTMAAFTYRGQMTYEYMQPYVQIQLAILIILKMLTIFNLYQ